MLISNADIAMCTESPYYSLIVIACRIATCTIAHYDNNSCIPTKTMYQGTINTVTMSNDQPNTLFPRQTIIIIQTEFNCACIIVIPHTCSREPQLSTSHLCIRCTPKIITNSSPNIGIADLNTSSHII